MLAAALAGLAAYRWGEARATWRRVRDGKITFRSQRKAAWRYTGRTALYIGIAVILILIVRPR